MRTDCWKALAAVGALLLAATPLSTATAQDEPPVTDPKAIWPADLARVAGTYRYAQVASPGGFWVSGEGTQQTQASINEVPAGLRSQLLQAEVIIADLKLPGTVSAQERLSPSKRGKLRFYTEAAIGRLAMKGLPGVSGGAEDRGAFAGPVQFQIDHSSHSNPSVSGILTLRQQQERTWGVATVDYADLTATPLLPNGLAPEDGSAAMMNARILRSGVEIFAYIEWEERGKRYVGSVRLQKAAPTPATGGAA